MLLIIGTTGLALSVLIFAIGLIGCRNPRRPVWARDILVETVYLPVIMCLALVGVGCFAKFILAADSRPPDVMEITLMAGIAAATLLLLKLMRIRQRLSEYEAIEKTADIIKPSVFFQKEDGTNDAPASPAGATPDKKAA